MRPHHKAEHMAAHDQIVKTPKPLATQAPSTQGLRAIFAPNPDPNPYACEKEGQNGGMVTAKQGLRKSDDPA